jgi:hypothetical protein
MMLHDNVELERSSLASMHLRSTVSYSLHYVIEQHTVHYTSVRNAAVVGSNSRLSE